MELLLDGQTANTDGTQDTYELSTNLYYSETVVKCFGTFDGCTVTLQASADDTNWVAVGSDTTFTSAGFGVFYLPNKVSIRGSVTSAGASTDVSLGIL